MVRFALARKGLEVTMKEKIERLSERDYLHGERLTLGSRSAEVVRAYAGIWHCFCYVYGRIQVTGKDSPGLSYQQALRQAKIFVRTGERKETV